MLATARVTAFHAGEDTTKDESAMSKEGGAPPAVAADANDDADVLLDELKALPKNAPNGMLFFH